jgi:hypothetical protein
MKDTPPTIFPFVVGAGRSGTTLLRAILDSHPSLAVAHESHFLPEMLRNRERYEADGGLDHGAFIADLARDSWLARHNLSTADVEAAFAARPASTVADATRRVFEAYARARGKHLYGNKTPDHVLHIAQIAEAFPEARFVHIVRDGRDVALSLIETAWGPSNAAEAAIFWRRHVQAGRQAARGLSPDRYVEVSYEALVGDPEPVVRDVCTFLGLAMDDRMLRYYERAGEIVAAAKQPAIHERISLPPTRGLRDWRTSMSRPDVALFEALAGATLDEFGYERAFETIPRRTGLQARLYPVWSGRPWGRVARRVVGAARRR